MRFVIAVLLGLALVSSVRADDEEPAGDAWRAQVAAARARIEAEQRRLQAEFERQKEERLRNPPEPIVIDRARELSDMVLKDLSLQKGDVVSTVDGLFVFVGDPDSEHSPSDFVPVSPDQQHQ
jgi:hypothetical protein